MASAGDMENWMDLCISR